MSWADLHWNCFKRLVYISEQAVQIFLGVLKIMCHIFCTLLRNSISEEKGWIFDNVMCRVFCFFFFEAELLKQNIPVVQKRVYLLLISKRHTWSVTVNSILLKEVLNFLPVDLTNGYQHNVLELYHMYTHFCLGLVKQSGKLTVIWGVREGI